MEEMLAAKTGKKLSRLRKKVYRFVNAIELEVRHEEMEYLEDEEAMLYFLVEVFKEKYNEMMRERGEIDAIVEKLKDDTVFSREGLVEEYQAYIRELEAEILNMKRSMGNVGHNYPIDNDIKKSNNINNGLQNYRIKDEMIRKLEE